MYQDKQNQFSDAQALTATAASTNLIDLKASANNLGDGEPMAVVVNVDVAAGGTSPTLQIALQSDSADSFGSAATVAQSKSYAAADLTAGAVLVLPIPPGVDCERYVRVNYTLGGTSPTMTLTSSLMPMSMVQKYKSYAKGYTIS